LAELTERETALEYLQTLLQYVVRVSDTVSQEEVYEAVAATFAEGGGEQVKTLAQQWLDEGREEGREEGRAEGLREGLLKAIELGIELKFGAAGIALLPEIYSLANVNVLRALQEGLRRIDNLEDLQRIYRPYLGNPAAN
jgi:hypothetical protein